MAKKIEFNLREQATFRAAVSRAERGELVLNVGTGTVHVEGCLDEYYVTQPDNGPWIARLSRRGVEQLPWYSSCGTCDPGLNPRDRLPDRSGFDPLTTQLKATSLNASHVGRRPVIDGNLYPAILEIDHHQRINARSSRSTVTLHCAGEVSVTVEGRDLRLQLLRHDADPDAWLARQRRADTPSGDSLSSG